ncbi:hypothetical protein [Stigmatella aurantiaca]|uniref:hypothetical protein n=1 Tax=Stigmatella aurantiaca TaxID=41 RepID=UPI0003124C6C|nr:hypothetical protein [Stigmatella aurantiaca]
MRTLAMMLCALMVGCASEETSDAGQVPEAERAQTPEEVHTQAPGDFYIACGCGCCGGIAPVVRCLSQGETLQSIIARDKEQAASPNCPFQGCSLPVKYMDCSAASPSP